MSRSLLLLVLVIGGTCAVRNPTGHAVRRALKSGDEADELNCPEGFERHLSSCYAFADGPSTKTAAAAACWEYGAMLACVTTEAEATYLGQLVANRGQDYWIGLTDVISEGQWTMPCEATNFSYPWCPGEPNDGGGDGDVENGGDCVRIIGSTTPGNTAGCPRGQWADLDCSASHHTHDGERRPIGFICEINEAKQEDWWDDDDEWDDDDDSGGGHTNGVAIFFAVVGCLGCALSIACNVVLWRRRVDNSLGGRAAVGSTRAANLPLEVAEGAYRAPLQEPGALSVSVTE